MKKTLWVLVLALFTAFSCNEKPAEELTESGLKKSDFQTEIDGKKTDLYVLKNGNNMEVCITNYGGRIVSVMVPDKAGQMKDVVLGFDSIQDYVKYPNNFGATIGRYGNRIANGKFTIDEVEYQLPINNGPHTLHGGDNGFDVQVWNAEQINNHELKLTYTSKDGEEGFPGNVDCVVTFCLTEDNAIEITYEAETDKPTHVNLTNHSYFNLDGDPSQSNSDQLLMIDADYYTPIDSTVMTTGEILPVEGTDMDFKKPTAIGVRIDNYEFDQLKNGLGYDHNWVLNAKGDVKKVAATLQSPKTGIFMEMYTNEPGVQFYAGNFLDGTLTGKKGIVYNKRASVCLETQKYPNTPNNPEWPSTLLRPGEKYLSQCIYKFSVKK
jgi:aldose 1-epimerase